MDKVSKFTAQFNNFKTLKDGGYRLTLDMGQDAFTEIQKILKWTTIGELNFAIAIAPFKEITNSNKIETDEIAT